MRTTVLYLLGAAAVGYTANILSTKAEVATNLHERSVLPRVLISVVIGGIIYLVGSEYRRAFEPKSYQDLMAKYSL